MTKTPMLRTAGIALTVLLASAGCGGANSADAGGKSATSTTEEPADAGSSTTKADSAASSGDPCRLLTSAEAEVALGQAVRDAVKTVIPASPQTGHGFDCSYSSVDQSAGPASVHVALLGDSVPKDAWQQAAAAEDGVTAIDGVGELAYFDEYGEKLDVFDHARWIQVQMVNSENPADLVTALSAIARHAIERI